MTSEREAAGRVDGCPHVVTPHPSPTRLDRGHRTGDLAHRRCRRKPGKPLAQRISGEPCAPFEDSGGITGYQEITDVLAEPSHPEYRSTKAWVATAVGPWGSDDPGDADLDGARGELAALFGAAGADLSGLVDAATGVTADSPVAQFASELTVPLRSNLRRNGRRGDLLAPAELRDEDVADAVKPYARLIDRIGVEGLTLTKAGWMPRPSCSKV